MTFLKKIFIFPYIFLFAISCKHKVSHNEALDYYITIALQIKSVTSEVKSFSIYLTKFLKQHPLNKPINYATIDTFKKINTQLIQKIDERLIFLKELKSVDKESILKFDATICVKDIRYLVNGISKIISNNKYASYSTNQKTLIEINFKFREKILNTDASFYQKSSNSFIRKYNITDKELAKYGLN